MTVEEDRATELDGAHILVVEDEFLLLIELEAILRDAGAADVHLCRNVRDALARIGTHKITAAILDIRLGRTTSLPVARRLAEEGIPFLFHTGQMGADPILAEWPDCTVVPKPASRKVIVAALRQLAKG